MICDKIKALSSSSVKLDGPDDFSRLMLNKHVQDKIHEQMMRCLIRILHILVPHLQDTGDECIIFLAVNHGGGAKREIERGA